jgi:hypothetical protein
MPTKFQNRILNALKQKSPMDESELGHELYPDDRSWRGSHNGGPPGFQMGLSRSISLMQKAGLIHHSIKGPGPGQRLVWLANTERSE